MCDAAQMRDVLVPLCGLVLREVTEARHWRGGVRDDTDSGLVDVWMHFDGQEPVHITGHPDGFGTLVEFDEPYETYDLGQHGQFRVEPVRPDGLLATVVGHRLAGVAVISSEREGPRTGVGLRFDNHDLLVALWDDDFVLALDAMPAGLADCVSVGPWVESGASRPKGRR
jgi:hypothetical protein